MKFGLRRTLLLLGLVGALLVAAACDNGDGNGDGDATPEPLVPIAIDPVEDLAGFLTALPLAESTCSLATLGVTSMDEASGADTEGIDFDALLDCLSDETMIRIALGQFTLVVGDLAPSTTSCITDLGTDLDLAALFSPGDQSPETMSGMLAVLFCLEPAERTAFEASEMGMGGDGPTIDQLECIQGALGDEGLTQVMAMGDGSGDVPALDFLRSVVACGVDLGDEDEGIPSFTLEQIDCLIASGAGDEIDALFSGADVALPPLSLLSVLIDCGIDFGALTGD